MFWGHFRALLENCGKPLILGLHCKGVHIYSSLPPFLYKFVFIYIHTCICFCSCLCIYFAHFYYLSYWYVIVINILPLFCYSFCLLFIYFVIKKYSSIGIWMNNDYWFVGSHFQDFIINNKYFFFLLFK